MFLHILQAVFGTQKLHEALILGSFGNHYFGATISGWFEALGNIYFRNGSCLFLLLFPLLNHELFQYRLDFCWGENSQSSQLTLDCFQKIGGWIMALEGLTVALNTFVILLLCFDYFLKLLATFRTILKGNMQ